MARGGLHKASEDSGCFVQPCIPCIFLRDFLKRYIGSFTWMQLTEDGKDNESVRKSFDKWGRADNCRKFTLTCILRYFIQLGPDACVRMKYSFSWMDYY